MIPTSILIWQIDLVGNVGNISATCHPNTPRSHNLGDITNAVTGFMAGSCVGLDIYLVFFYLDIYMVNFFRSTTVMFPLLPPPERVVPIFGIIHKTHGRTCDVHRLGDGTVLLSMRTTHSFGGLLHRPGNGTGPSHHLFCSRLHERSFKVLVCKTNQFYFKYEKIIN